MCNESIKMELIASEHNGQQFFFNLCIIAIGVTETP